MIILLQTTTSPNKYQHKENLYSVQQNVGQTFTNEPPILKGLDIDKHLWSVFDICSNKL